MGPVLEESLEKVAVLWSSDWDLLMLFEKLQLMPDVNIYIFPRGAKPAPCEFEDVFAGNPDTVCCVPPRHERQCKTKSS